MRKRDFYDVARDAWDGAGLCAFEADNGRITLVDPLDGAEDVYVISLGGRLHFALPIEGWCTPQGSSRVLNGILRQPVIPDPDPVKRGWIVECSDGAIYVRGARGRKRGRFVR